jgi:hypothetical protein
MSNTDFHLVPELPSNTDIKVWVQGELRFIQGNVDLNDMSLHSQEFGVAVLVYYWTETALFNIHGT